MRYIDTHCHLNGQYFEENVEEAIANANKDGVEKIILPGTSINDSLEAISMSKKYKNVFAAVGIHPVDVLENSADFLDNINPEDVVAVGETGVDLYREGNPPVEAQVASFIKHIEWAIKHDKVLIVHMRDAEQEVYDILVKYSNLKFVMHSYTASLEWAKKFIDLGAYFSMSGIVTFKNAKEVQEVAKYIPLDKLLSETDAPFLSPVPKRGKPNKPENVVYTAKFIAELREEENEVVLESLYNNAIKLFKI